MGMSICKSQGYDNSSGLLQLNMTKGSQMRLITKKKSERYTDCIQQSVSVDSIRSVCQPETPPESSTEFNLYGYILKLVTSKSSTLSSENDIWKFIVVTSTQTLVCIEVDPKGFIT